MPRNSSVPILKPNVDFPQLHISMATNESIPKSAGETEVWMWSSGYSTRLNNFPISLAKKPGVPGSPRAYASCLGVVSQALGVSLDKSDPDLSMVVLMFRYGTSFFHDARWLRGVVEAKPRPEDNAFIVPQLGITPANGYSHPGHF